MARRPQRASRANSQRDAQAAARNILVGRGPTNARAVARDRSTFQNRDRRVQRSARKLARREGISLGSAARRVVNASRVRGSGAAVNNRPRFDAASAAISADAGVRIGRSRRARLAFAQ